MLEKNNHFTAETIAALITPPGRGGVGIIRVSGSRVVDVSNVILGLLPQARIASYLPFFDENHVVIDKGVAIYFPSPHSLTGEDVLEFQGHGSSVVLDYLLKQILKLGVRMAKPGEFSERAFLNGKIDLTQAEATADLINANSMQAARSAIRSMQGEFSRLINQLVSSLIQLRIYIEATIDFPEEDINFLKNGAIKEKLNTLLMEIKTSLCGATQGALLRDGITVVIAGSPNVGKSSLLNQLTGNDSAIVSNIPGTTRDVLHEFVHINGLPLHLIDTAGLRESDDPIEKEGMRRANNEITKADQILLITDESKNSIDELKKIPPSLQHKVTIICNKIDLTEKKAGIEKIDSYFFIYLSARTGEGLPFLYEHLKSIVGYSVTQEGVFAARRRHLTALELAQKHLEQACAYIQLPEPCSELLAEELRLAQNTLSEITGEFKSDDLLGEIFSSFCVGK